MSSRYDDLLRSGSVVLLGLAANLVLSFVLRLIMARTLGRVDYGAIVIGISVLTMGQTVVVLGLHSGVARYLPRYDDPARRRGVIVSALQVSLPLAVGVGVLAVALAGPAASYVFHDPSVGPVIRVFGAAIPFAVVVVLFVGTAQGLGRAVPKALNDLSLPLVQIVLVGGSLLGGLALAWVAGAYVAGYVVLAVGGGYYLLRRTPLGARVDVRPMHRELVAFSVPIMVSSFAVSMLSNVDVFMMGYFASTGDVGIYSAMYSLSNLLSVFLFAVGYVYMPAVSALDADGDRAGIDDVYQAATSLTTTVTLPVLLAILVVPDLIIGLSFGPDFVPGANALRALALGYAFHAVVGPNMRTLMSIGRARAIMVNNVVAFSANVALNLVLIPRYGFVGAALATTASYVLMNALYSLVLYRELGIYPRPSSVAVRRALGTIRP